MVEVVKVTFQEPMEKAEGLNETLGKRLAKTNVEIFGYASSWI